MPKCITSVDKIAEMSENLVLDINRYIQLKGIGDDQKAILEHEQIWT